MLIKEAIHYYKVKLIENKWRRKNKHNETSINAENPFEMDSVKVGKGTYGKLHVINDTDYAKLIIGNYCSIGGNTIFILGREHRTDTISTYPFKYFINNRTHEAFSKGNIVIDDDVWIGHGCTILSGVHINQGAIVATGAVVTKDIPPYAIVGGVPAKLIRYRFNNEIINELMNIDYNKIDFDLIKKHLPEMYNKLENVDQLKWLPKK